MLETGVVIEGVSPLLQRNLDQFDAATIKVPSMWAATFNALMSAEFATENSKLLTGQYSPDDYIEVINPIWAKNFE